MPGEKLFIFKKQESTQDLVPDPKGKEHTKRGQEKEKMKWC